MAHQGLEHGELAGGQWHVLAALAQGALTEIELERAKLHHLLLQRRRARHLGWRAAAQHGVDAGQQLAGVEGFAQVVVGAHFEAHDAVHVFAFGGEHDDGRAVVGGAQAAANAQAVFAGHHQVQHDQVHRIPQQQAVQCAAVFGHGDFKALLRKVAAQQVADAGVVVNDHNFVGAVGGVRVHRGLLHM